MKHYLMVFFILFSSLSLSWAGSGAYQNNTGSQTSSQVEAELHESCPSMNQPDFSSTDEHLFCMSCFDGCQCDQSACHKIISSLAGVQFSRFNVQVLTENPVIFVQSNLETSLIIPEFRPPKTL